LLYERQDHQSLSMMASATHSPYSLLLHLLNTIAKYNL
jgi:hypothetical protein